jgi:hypothetical protein
MGALKLALKRIVKLTVEYADDYDKGRVALGAYEACSKIKKVADAALKAREMEKK